MNKWSVKIFNYKFGVDQNGNWFLQRFENKSMRHAIHSRKLRDVFKVIC